MPKTQHLLNYQAETKEEALLRTEDRLEFIMRTAIRDNFVSISETARHLDVSIETVRRDINRLCAENRLRKVRGGACPVKLSMRRDAEYMLRKTQNQQVKLAIGRAAARMITDGKVVIFDCGVSIQQIAASVTGVEDVTFITNSVPTMSILLDKFSSGEITGRVIMIGGEIDAKNRFAIGASAVESMRQFCADLAFVSCTALSARGVSSFDLAESSFSSAILECTSYSVLIAESEKLGKNSVHRFAAPTDFSAIITDDQNHVPADILDLLETSDTALTIVEMN